MLRHATAPARAFAQIPNLILRHPRLSPAAKTLLTWQLSLPADERQCLSETARRARIPKTAFQRAKSELKAEGYLHEWRVQTDGGRFTTVQLVSNVVLTPQEAAALRDGRPGGTKRTPGVAAKPPAGRQPPTAASPAAGEPTGRAVGRQPEKNTGEDTDRPTPAVTAPRPTRAHRDGASRTRRAAEAFLRALALADRRLAMSERTIRDVAPLAEPWLGSHLSTEQIARTLTGGLSEARSPVGLLRWRLAHLLPDTPPPPPPAAARPAPRVASMRECQGRHTQPRLFTPPPGSDEKRCPDCRTEPGERTAPRPDPGSGYAAFRRARARRTGEARQAAPPIPPARHPRGPRAEEPPRARRRAPADDGLGRPRTPVLADGVRT